MTDHLELSIITGTRVMSGSEATRLRKRTMAGFAVEHAFVEVDVDDLGAFFDLLTRDGKRRGEVVFLD